MRLAPGGGGRKGCRDRRGAKPVPPALPRSRWMLGTLRFAQPTATTLPSSRAKRGDLLTTGYLPGDCFAGARNDGGCRCEERQRRGNLLLRRTPFTRAVAGCDCRGQSAREGRSRSGPRDAAPDRPRKAWPAAEESAWGTSFLRRIFSTRKKCDSRLVWAVKKNVVSDEARNRCHRHCHEAAGCWARFALPNLRLRRSCHRERSVAIS